MVKRSGCFYLDEDVYTFISRAVLNYSESMKNKEIYNIFFHQDIMSETSVNIVFGYFLFKMFSVT